MADTAIHHLHDTSILDRIGQFARGALAWIIESRIRHARQYVNANLALLDDETLASLNIDRSEVEADAGPTAVYLH
jgi:hypothetical protein